MGRPESLWTKLKRVSDPENKHWKWQKLGSPDLFWCMRYDDVVRLHPELVVAYDATYWVKNGATVDFGERVPV